MSDYTQYNLHEFLEVALPSAQTIRDAHFSSMELPLAGLGNAVFVSCTFDRVTFLGSSESFRMVHSQLTDCSFANGVLTSPCFDHVRLTRTDFRQARIAGGTFRDVELDSCDLRCSHFNFGHWERVKIAHSAFDYATIENSQFAKTEFGLEGTSFAKATLASSTFLDCLMPSALFDPQLMEVKSCVVIASEALPSIGALRSAGFECVDQTAPTEAAADVQAAPVVQQAKKAVQVAPPSAPAPTAPAPKATSQNNRFQCIPIPAAEGERKEGGASDA